MTPLHRRVARLRERRRDPRVRLEQTGQVGKIAGVAGADTALTAFDYIVNTMGPVGAWHTQRSFAAAERVQQTLLNAGIPATFEHQGSVTNDTHIQVHSDIDLLVLTDAFYALEPPLRPPDPYLGDPSSTLLRLRHDCEAALAREFGAKAVDMAGAKAVAVRSPRLACHVDVVPSNWYETEWSFGALDNTYRGIQVLHRPTLERVTNFPFLHNAKLATRDDETGGMLRRLIRLVKSVRSDSDLSIAVSSYDIASLCFNMPDEYFPPDSDDVRLAVGFMTFGVDLLADDSLLNSLMVPNSTRRVFSSGALQRDQLRVLLGELGDLLQTALRRDRLVG